MARRSTARSLAGALCALTMLLQFGMTAHSAAMTPEEPGEQAARSAAETAGGGGTLKI